MVRKRRTPGEETVAIIHGIHPTLRQVRTVWVQRDGGLAGSRPDGTFFTHRPHPNSDALSQAALVFGLAEAFSVPIALLDSDATSQKVAALREKAANWPADDTKA